VAQKIQAQQRDESQMIGYEIIRDEMEWGFNSTVPIVTNERG